MQAVQQSYKKNQKKLDFPHAPNCLGNTIVIHSFQNLIWPSTHQLKSTQNSLTNNLSCSINEWKYWNRVSNYLFLQRMGQNIPIHSLNTFLKISGNSYNSIWSFSFIHDIVCITKSIYQYAAQWKKQKYETEFFLLNLLVNQVWKCTLANNNNNNINNNNNNCITRAPSHVKHTQLPWTSADTKI